MTTTGYSDVRSIRADLERWRDEGADPTEARAALLDAYYRASDKAQAALGDLDSEMFDVVIDEPTLWRDAE